MKNTMEGDESLMKVWLNEFMSAQRRGTLGMDKQTTLSPTERTSANVQLAAWHESPQMKLHDWTRGCLIWQAGKVHQQPVQPDVPKAPTSSQHG